MPTAAIWPKTCATLKPRGTLRNTSRERGSEPPELGVWRRFRLEVCSRTQGTMPRYTRKVSAFPTMPLEFFSAIDTGRARTNNEDSVALDEATALVVLADGMGGYNAGEVASGMLTSFIKSELGRWLHEA